MSKELPTTGFILDEDLYAKAVEIVIADNKASTSYIQRRLQLGYNHSSRIMERMEKEGIVTPSDHVGKRTVLRKTP